MVTTPTIFGPSDLVALRDCSPTVRIIDVRTPNEFAAGHIPGAYNVPLPDLAAHRAELTATQAGPVVLVCQSGRRAETAESRLANAGLSEVHVLAGGVTAWIAAGHAIAAEAGATGWTIERQVRGVAGAIVATAIFLSLWWAPVRFIAGALGVGLLFSAVTDTCALGNLLGRLPWNRRRAGTCDLPTVVTALVPDAEASR